jgi:hypothetical protein
MKGQAWSLDAILAIGVVLVAIIGFVMFTSDSFSKEGTKRLVEENTALSAGTQGPEQSSLSVIMQQLDEARVLRLSKMPYTNAKRELGLTTDFCIHFTDNDGNIIPIGGVWFLGSPDLNVTVPGPLNEQYVFTCNGTLLAPSCDTVKDTALASVCKG